MCTVVYWIYSDSSFLFILTVIWVITLYLRGIITCANMHKYNWRCVFVFTAISEVTWEQACMIGPTLLDHWDMLIYGRPINLYLSALPTHRNWPRSHDFPERYRSSVPWELITDRLHYGTNCARQTQNIWLWQ